MFSNLRCKILGHDFEAPGNIWTLPIQRSCRDRLNLQM